MKKVKITFEFKYSETGKMTTTHQGEGIDKDAAISSAWLNMAADNFPRKIILSTKSISVVEIEEMSNQ